MFEKLRILSGIGVPKVDHPLADARELRRILGEIPTTQPIKALEEIVGWLESLRDTPDFPELRLYEAASQLDDAAQPCLRALSRDYLHSPRLALADEKRLWTMSHGFWTALAAVYERGLATVREQGRSREQLKPVLPGLCARQINALGNVLKWVQFRSGSAPGNLWQRLGGALLAAEAAGVATHLTRLRSNQQGMTSPQQEFIRILGLQAASLDSLLPMEIEIAERLIAHFQPEFVFGAVAAHDSVYWIDLALDQPPTRLARMPPQARPSQRFFKAGAAHAGIVTLLQEIEQGHDIPGEINLGGHYQAGTLIAVLRHLAAYLAPIPPQRRHGRHDVRQPAELLYGLANARAAFSGKLGSGDAGAANAGWLVENVSRGGFGAVLGGIPAAWLKVGALVTMRPAGGDHWQLGVVRRYQRGETESRVGIETLALRAEPGELRTRAASSYSALAGIPALLIQEGCPNGELRALMPVGSFDLGETLECDLHGRRTCLTPVALVERGADFELARYRVSATA